MKARPERGIPEEEMRETLGGASQKTYFLSSHSEGLEFLSLTGIPKGRGGWVLPSAFLPLCWQVFGLEPLCEAGSDNCPHLTLVLIPRIFQNGDYHLQTFPKVFLLE